MDDQERERRAREAREKHRAEMQARVDQALGDPGLKAALADLKAQTPEGEAMFGFQVKVADARAEVPSAEEIDASEGPALVTQKEAAAAYVAAKVPARMSPRMPTGRIKVPMRAEEIAQRRQATMPSLRKQEAAGLRAGVGVTGSVDEPESGEGAADVDATDVGAADAGAMVEPFDDGALADKSDVTSEMHATSEMRATNESALSEAAAVTGRVHVKPIEGSATTRARSDAARVDAPRETRRGFAIGVVVLLGATVIAIGVLRGRPSGGVANGANEATTVRAESAALSGVGAPTCANMGRPPCPTVSESAEPVAVTSAGVGTAAPRVNASATMSGSAGTSAKATSTSTDQVYEDPAAPAGSGAASAVPSSAPAAVSSPTVTAPAISPTPTFTPASPDRFGEQLDHHR